MTDTLLGVWNIMLQIGGLNLRTPSSCSPESGKSWNGVPVRMVSGGASFLPCTERIGVSLLLLD